jgi:hypothetical protein
VHVAYLDRQLHGNRNRGHGSERKCKVDESVRVQGHWTDGRICWEQGGNKQQKKSLSSQCCCRVSLMSSESMPSAK